MVQKHAQYDRNSPTSGDSLLLDDGYGDFDPLIADSLRKFRTCTYELLTTTPRVTPDELKAAAHELISQFEIAHEMMYTSQIREIFGEVMRLERLLVDHRPGYEDVRGISYAMAGRLNYETLDAIREHWENDLFSIIDGLADEAMERPDFLRDALRVKAYINGYGSVAEYYATAKEQPDSPIVRYELDRTPWIVMDNMPDSNTDDPSIRADELELAQEEFGDIYLRQCLGLPDNYVDAMCRSVHERYHPQDNNERLDADGWRLYLERVGGNVAEFGVNGLIKLWNSPAGILGVGDYMAYELRPTYALITGDAEYLDQLKDCSIIYVVRTQDKDHNGAFQSVGELYGSNDYSVPYFQEISVADEASLKMSEYAALLTSSEQHPEVTVIAAHGDIGGFLLRGGMIMTTDVYNPEATSNITRDDNHISASELQGLFDIVRVMRPDVTGAYSIVMDSCLQGSKDAWGISMLEELADTLREHISAPGVVHLYGSDESFQKEQQANGDIRFIVTNDDLRGSGVSVLNKPESFEANVLHVFYDAQGTLHTIRQDVLSLPALQRSLPGVAEADRA